MGEIGAEPAHYWVTRAALCVFHPQLRLFEGEGTSEAKSPLSCVLRNKGRGLSLPQGMKSPHRLAIYSMPP